MTLQRIDNISIVFEDLPAAVKFFTELGMEVEGKARVNGEWVGRVIALKDVDADIVMMKSPDGTKLELTSFRNPKAVRTEPKNGLSNALGIRRIMFAVRDIDDVVARLQKIGGELMGEIMNYENTYRLCYMRGPEGVMIALAEELK